VWAFTHSQVREDRDADGCRSHPFALKDAGVGWKDIEFGSVASHEVSNPDA